MESVYAKKSVPDGIGKLGIRIAEKSVNRVKI
jgi:hypothetical protein